MKRAGEIDGALRRVAKQRDKLLSNAPTLSPARQEILAGFLVREFLIDAALRDTAMKRDELLKRRAPEIPVSIESTLHRQLVAAQAARDRIREWPEWLRFFRSPLSGALTICAIIAAAIACFGRWGIPARHSAENFPHADRVNIESGVKLEAELFARKISIGPFNLKTNEPASLQASFLANSGVYFADGIQTPLGLRLDLPVRAILTEDGFARTP